MDEDADGAGIPPGEIGKREDVPEDFEDLTSDEIARRAAELGPDRMPGTGRQVPNAWAQLKDEMDAAGVTRAGDLARERIDHHRFTTKEHYAKITPRLLGAAGEKPKLLGSGMDQPRLLGAEGVGEAEKPSPPTSWAGRFLAVYPDGTTSDYDLTGHELRPGGVLPSGHILERFEVSDQEVEPGKWMVVGVLRDPDGDPDE